MGFVDRTLILLSAYGNMTGFRNSLRTVELEPYTLLEFIKQSKCGLWAGDSRIAKYNLLFTQSHMTLCRREVCKQWESGIFWYNELFTETYMSFCRKHRYIARVSALF